MVVFGSACAFVRWLGVVQMGDDVKFMLSCVVLVIIQQSVGVVAMHLIDGTKVQRYIAAHVASQKWRGAKTFSWHPRNKFLFFSCRLASGVPLTLYLFICRVSFVFVSMGSALVVVPSLRSCLSFLRIWFQRVFPFWYVLPIVIFHRWGTCFFRRRRVVRCLVSCRWCGRTSFSI